MKPALGVLKGGLLLSALLLVAFSPQCLAGMIAQVPDTQQPITGSLGNPPFNACAPVSVVNVTHFWDVVRSHPNSFMVDAGLIPNTAADYIAYFVDQGNVGSPVRLNGTAFPPSVGTYAADIQPGFFEFVRWDAANLFTTPPPALPAGKLGYNWSFSSDFVIGFNAHSAEIDSGRPDVICFRYWNPVFSGLVIADPGGSGESVEFYTWGPQVPSSNPPNPPEQWNLNYGQECVGHAVTGVGYYRNFDPDGPGPLPNTNWFVCHDNWPSTGVNIALPWNNWAATIFANPGTAPEPEISYWKPDTTYAQTGMPDFPSQYPCHSGPTAVTNCLWWYGAMDYYPFVSPWSLKNELFTFFGSDTIFDPWGGTDVHQLEAGLDSFFNGVIPPWPFYETTYQMPDFRVMAESLMKCQDVILLIGNWWMDGEGFWHRDGGRYVTMAGVDTASMMIALSDPETDNAETGAWGRVRPPHPSHSAQDSTHWNPMTPGLYDYPVSHDIYRVILGSPSPGGTWWLPNFPRGFSPSYANCPSEFVQMTAPNPDPTIYPYHAEVEYAVMICPRELEEPIDTCNFYKAPYPDYSQNGMPDFDQKQDGWWNPISGNFSWCGPVALANCLWWFDSKFESTPIDPRPFYPDPTSPPINDHYPLVPAYGPWDDHDTNNVIPFISQLGPICNVDGLNQGTSLADLQAGLNNWLMMHDLQDQFTSHILIGPEYPELRDSIISSQDLILQLGFYEVMYTGDCQWLGSHYVTCAGVCTQEPSICISDPFFDTNEGEPPPGTAHTPDIHNDAWHVSGPHGTINHDRYNMVMAAGQCPMSPATWRMIDYPNQWLQDGIFTFANENPLLPGQSAGLYTGGQILVLVDAALIICPAQPQQVPDIDIVPDSIFHQQHINTIVTYASDFSISNFGNANLTYNLNNTLPWVTFANVSGLIIPGGSDTVDVIVNTAGIVPGIYLDSVTVSSNDPDEPIINKPIIAIQVLRDEIDTCDFYKAPYLDYSQNGMPDFDQKQNGWFNPANGRFTWCGPVALANCIWWFDSKFESNPVDPRPFYPAAGTPPPNDNYPLLSPYGPWDDHDTNNVIPFVTQLGPLCNVDGISPGTPLPDLHNGFQNWLIIHDLIGQFTSHVVFGPQFPEIRDSIISSQDVILLLGFYEHTPAGQFQWLGGHYVTCAGVCTQESSICISDPFFDSNEGEPPPGTAHTSNVHNDAWFVSGPHGTINHDRYNMAPQPYPLPSPATWMMTDYPNQWFLDGINNFADQNPLAPMPPVMYQGGEVIVAVDAALIICPAEPQQAPDINVVPDSLYHSQQVDLTMTYIDDFVISNNGTAVLTYSAINTLSWIVLGGITGTIPPAGSESISLTVNTTGIAVGVYVDSVTINSNDPDTPVINRPKIVIEVTESGYVCNAVPGDANGNGVFNGIDVTYSVNYLKGIGPIPPDTCNCPPSGVIRAAADANGNCAFNGIDVTFSVNYLKGIGPAPSLCPDCPTLILMPTSSPDTKPAGIR